jgi:hypothetical protein
MFAISHVNLLTLMKGTPSCVPDAAAGFPVTNLYRGWPWRPFRFSEAGANEVIFDTSIIFEDFNTAFVGGLPPGSYWSKTDDATCTRNTTDQFEGSGCLAVGGLVNNYVALNFTWPAGAMFVWSAAIRLLSLLSFGSSAYIQLVDVDANRGYVDGVVPTWAEVGAGTLASNPGIAWLERLNAIRVSAPAIAGRAMTRMQLRFYAPGFGQTALFDIVRCWSEPDMMAVLGSNMPPSSNAPALGADGGILWEVGPPKRSPNFQLSVPNPTSWALELEGFKSRRSNGGYIARLSCPRPPVLDPVALGWVWLGAFTTLPEGPEYPIQVREMFPQERVGGGGYESQAVRRGDLAPRRLELSVSAVSVEKVEEVFSALRMANYGTDKCVLIAPYKNVDTAFYGRVLGPEGIVTSQGSFNSVRATVIFEEEPFLRFSA